jgi:two-component system chemotaxis response regulator CheY
MKKILIVDDSPTVREHIKALLEGEFECITAVDGADGLDKAVSTHPDAIICDIQMPEMDGVQMLRELRSQPDMKTVPVLIATTVMAIDKVNECHALGCTGFVLKPVQKEYLIAKLRQVMKAVPHVGF